MEKIKTYVQIVLQISLIIALLFVAFKISHIFGALDRAEKLIHSAIIKIDSADAKIVRTQTLLNQLDSLASTNQKQVDSIKQACQNLAWAFKKAQENDRQQLNLNRVKLDSIYNTVKKLPNF